MRSTGGTVGSASTEERSDGVRIRPLEERELSAADRVYRLAFGMQFGLPDPMQYRGDAQILRPRWATTPGATLVAELDGEVVGSWTGCTSTSDASAWNRSTNMSAEAELVCGIDLVPFVGPADAPFGPAWSGHPFASGAGRRASAAPAAPARP